MNENEPNDSNDINNDIKESLDSLPIEERDEVKSEPEAYRRPVDNYEFPVKSHNPPKKSNKKLFIILMVAVVLVATVFAVWYFMQSSKGNSQNNKSGANIVNNSAPKETDPQLAKFITPTTGETWLDKPAAITKQGFFKSYSFGGGEADTEYYNVGSRGDRTIILTATPSIYISYALFEKSKDGTIVMVTHPDGLAVYNQEYEVGLAESLSSKVTVSSDIHYDSLSIPSQIKIDDKDSVVMAPVYPGLGMPYSSPKADSGVKEYTIKKLGNSVLMKSESTNKDTGLVSVSYYMKTPLNTSIALRYEPLDLSLDKYQWSSGYSASDSLKAITHGCGSLTASVTKTNDISADDVEEIGKSAKGLTVYALKDSSNTLVQKAYQEFKDFYKYDETNYLRNVSLEEFVKYHALVIYKDVNGDWLVYIRAQFAPAGGCAKPVVYLYPTSTQIVNVKVGADVKISDPYYNPDTGWTALAKPNGQLTVNGTNYGSLFWEGPGFGEYPAINSGTVVKQSDLLSTIRKHLAQQGLNTTETNDFMEYWQGKLPTQPYVRLTWLTTVQMNKLAPLHITPKPDTVIRVFLDANGMDKPVNINSQTLKSVPRKGFTVVEWGGLAGFRLY